MLPGTLMFLGTSKDKQTLHFRYFPAGFEEESDAPTIISSEDQ